jgi:hypothetical protein
VTDPDLEPDFDDGEFILAAQAGSFDDDLDDEDPPGEDEPDSGGANGYERDVDPDNPAEDEPEDDD